MRFAEVLVLAGFLLLPARGMQQKILVKEKGKERFFAKFSLGEVYQGVKK